MNLSTYLGLVRQHIAGGDMDAALQQLRALLDNSPKLDEALHHSGRWQDIRRQIRLGTVSHAEATLTQNQIQAALLDLLRDIESQTGETVPDGKAMRKEVERAIEISHSKNVVGGSSISAGGDVKIGDHNEVHHHYGDVRIPEKLTTAGAVVPKDFIGRGRELGEIRERLGAGNGALALVNAEGGMGKTTLAAAYWEGFASKYKHLAWLFCEKGILPAMREQLAGPLGLREDMNAVADDPEKQIELIRTRMANLPKDCLLVLDNANEPDHIRDFERHCTGLGWHVLITSRCSRVLRDEGNEYPITSLPPVEARALFKKNYTEEGADFENLLGSFLEAVGYNTLCIEIFSKNLREGAAWGLDFENLLQHLEQNGLRLGADSFEIRTPYTQHIHSDAATSDEVVEAMYDLGRLSPDENDLFARVCLLPAEQHPPAVLTALLDPNDKAGLKRRLDELAKKGWLGADPAGYRVSPVVQKIVLDKHAARRWELGEVIVQRLQVIFENEGFHSKNIGTAGPFADLAFDLIDNLAIANEDLANLLHRLWVYRNATGDLANALGTAQKMAFLCLEVDDKYNLGRAYDLIGYTYRNLGNLDKSLEYVENYHRLVKELYDSNPQKVAFKDALAISYEKLGKMYSLSGNLERALQFFEEYNRLEKELYDSNPQHVRFKNGLAISYEKLGSTHSALGNPEKALEFFEQYNRLEKELHSDYPKNVEFKNVSAISYLKLGETHSVLGNPEKALEFFEQFNRLEKELYESYPQNVSLKNSLAVSYAQLGAFYWDKKGDAATAKPYFQQCYQLWKELSEAYPAYAEFRDNFEWAKKALEQ